MMRLIFFSLTVLLFSCSEPLANKCSETTFESDLASMVETSVLTKTDARKIRCTMFLGEVLKKDLTHKSYEEVLNSFNDEQDDLSFNSMSMLYSRSLLDSALSCELFKVQVKQLRGKVYFGFRLKNETDKKVVAYAGIITITDVFGKQMYSGPFENQRKSIATSRSREFWVKLDKSNGDVKMAMKNNQCDFKWDSQTVVFEGGESLKLGEYETVATEEFELELKGLISAKTSI